MGFMRRSLAGEVIRGEFRKSFHSDESTNETKFEFIRRYLKVYEELYENMNNVFFINNPMLDSGPLKGGPTEIDSECLSFLVRMTKIVSEREKGNKGDKFDDLSKYVITNRGFAYSLLGMIYEFGAFSVPQSIIKAVNFYISGTKFANTLGTYRLALCFEKGIGKNASIEKALVFYRCSAKLGGVEAMHTYGCILINGSMGVMKEQANGLLYLKLAAKLASDHYPYPLYDLASIFEHPGDILDIWEDHEYALSLYKKGASLGCANCQFRIGSAYENGEIGLEINVREMLSFYDKAASMFHVEAMYIMANYNTIGHPPYMERNIKLAYDLAVRAATRHHVDATFLVAQILEEEPLFNRDPVIALWWYKIAESMGHSGTKPKIQKLLAEIAKKGGNTQSPKGCKLI